MRVMIVDDSMLFRSMIRRALEAIPGVTVAGSASNGKIALEQLKSLNVDLITLDMNMPEMDGLATLRGLKAAGTSAKTIVFAARTANSARETIEALKLGAFDFVVKPEAESVEAAFDNLHGQLNSLISGLQKSTPTLAPPAPKAPEQKKNFVDPLMFHPMAVVIASSTGGPMALEQVVASLRAPLKIPVFLAQHMPPTFTKALGERLSRITGVECREAIDGELVRPGIFYIAPGDFHMRLNFEKSQLTISLDQSPRLHFVRPAADLLFESAVKHYGSNLGAMVLTGMGSDGCAGAMGVKKSGGSVMIQDKDSAVVWGMPGAVHDAGAYDRMGDLQDCAMILSRWCN